MFKRMSLMVVLVILFLGGIGYWKYLKIQAGIAKGAKFAGMTTAVTTTRVKAQTWQPVLNAVGSLKAINGVMISTDLAGIVSEIAFESGTAVKKGALLLKLDTQQEEAQLRSMEAKRDLAKLDLERKRDLVAKKAISSAEFDTAESALSQAQAAVQETKALAGRKRIAAPFDGVLGIRQVNLGQYVNPGAAMVPLESLDPIYVVFALPQQHIGTVAKGGELRLNASGINGTPFEGQITAVDSRVDEATRNIMIQGTVANTERKLRPGMFVDVEVLLPEVSGILAIPSSSIAYAPYGDSVYIVVAKTGADGKTVTEVQQQFVKLGAKRGDQVTVLSGLKEGDEVVSSGVFKLRPAIPVKVDNSVQPGNDLHPTPADT